MRTSYSRRVMLLAAVLALSATPPAFADAVLQYRSSDGSRVVFSLSPSRFKVDIQVVGRSAGLLYDEGKRTLWLLDHDRRSYLELSEERLRQYREARRQLEARLQQLPPALQAQAEAMLTPPGFARIPRVPADPCEGQKIVGVEPVRGLRARVVDGCKTLVQQKWAICRYWIVHGEELRLALSDFRALEGFLSFYLELLRTLGSPQLIEDSSLFLQPKARRLPDPVFAFPVVVKAAVVQDGKELKTITLDTHSAGPVSGEELSLPAGYSKLDLPSPTR